MQTTSGVQFTDINKSYGATKVLNDINLTVKEGEFAVLVGPSGSGKSTLLRSLAGLESIDTGRITIGSKDVTHLAPKDRDVAMVFQNYALYPHMSIAQNITFGMTIRKESKEAQAKALEFVAKMLRLEGLLHRKPRELSGGQRQRVAMARAIVRNPKVFLMDEPLSNLDAKLRNEVRGAIIEQQRKLGVTTLYVTHDQVEAMTMAHRVVVLLDGKIQQVGSPEELYHTPANAFVANFIGNPGMNILSAVYTGEGLSCGKSEAFALDSTHSIHAGMQRHAQACGVSFHLGVRPESIALAPKQTRDMALKACVCGREMLGASYELHARLASDEVLTFTVPSTVAVPALNEQVQLYISPMAIHGFAQESGAAVFHANPQ